MLAKSLWVGTLSIKTQHILMHRCSLSFSGEDGIALRKNLLKVKLTQEKKKLI
jgi:hypothetical protein